VAETLKVVLLLLLVLLFLLLLLLVPGLLLEVHDPPA